MLVSEVGEINYLAPFGYAPLLPIEDAHSAYVVFVKFLNQPVPPQNVPMLVGSGSKVEPLSDESGVAGGLEASQFRTPHVISSRKSPTRRSPSPVGL